MCVCVDGASLFLSFKCIKGFSPFFCLLSTVFFISSGRFGHSLTFPPHSSLCHQCCHMASSFFSLSVIQSSCVSPALCQVPPLVNRKVIGSRSLPLVQRFIWTLLSVSKHAQWSISANPQWALFVSTLWRAKRRPLSNRHSWLEQHKLIGHIETA